MRSTRFILLADLALLVLFGFGVYRYWQKAALPFDLSPKNDTLYVVKSHAASVPDGSVIAAIDDKRVSSRDGAEFLLDRYAIGDTAILTITIGAEEVRKPVELVHHYSLTYKIISFASGLIFLVVGLIVILRLPKSKAAQAFHAICICIAAMILLTSGRITLPPVWMGYVLKVVFHIAGILTPVFFLTFTFLFPREEFTRRRKLLIRVIVICGLLLEIFVANSFFRSLEHYETSYQFYALGLKLFTIFFMLVFFFGLTVLFRSYSQAEDESERKKLRWILFGISAGVFDFIFLWEIPKRFFGMTFVPEETMLLLAVIAPVSFAIAIVRYRLFNIDVIIKRSTVYVIVIGILFALYLGIVALLADTLSDAVGSSSAASVVGALVVAFLFEPVRRSVQRFVEKRFLRSSFDVRSEEKRLTEEAKNTVSIAALGELVTTRTGELIPVERIGFFILEETSGRLKLIAHRGFDLLADRGLTFQSEQLKSDLSEPIILQSLAPKDVRSEKADEEVFGRWGIASAFPIKTEGQIASGFLVLGQRRSGSRFTPDDIEFISSTAIQSSIAIERIRLYEKLLVEQAESERLGELSRMKSYFVSSVSHDLKTPLASIKLFAEMLKEKEDLSREKKEKYLGIIEGESERLSRLISNVLDFAKIERGTKDFRFSLCDLNTIAREVLEMMSYQFEGGGFAVSSYFYPGELLLEADRDAIFDSIMNLLSNAMKYSGGNKEIALETGMKDGFAFISVRDNGIGIAKEEQQNIFDAFYRVRDGKADAAGGAGLGLSIVHFSVEAHGGRIEVTSDAGKGSTFTIFLPLKRN
jgi:signal transduction histidine kinase